MANVIETNEVNLPFAPLICTVMICSGTCIMICSLDRTHKLDSNTMNVRGNHSTIPTTSTNLTTV